MAESLRRGTASLPQADLLELSRNADRFVGSAALSSLSRLADEWTPAEFSKWTVADRVQAVQALRLATVDPQPWIDALLEDDSPGVQFETLRWLADEDLRAYLPSVESLLGNSHLSYEVFEAAVAAHTALSGQPEIGMQNPDLLLARVQDDASSPAIRAFALRLLPIRSTAPVKDETTPTADLPEGLSLPLLKKLLAVQNPALSIEVVRVLGVNPAAFGNLLAELAADDSVESTLRAEAIVGLAAIAESHLPLLLQLTQHREGQLREEALRALRGTALTAKQKSELHAVARRSRGGRANLSPCQSRPMCPLPSREWTWQCWRTRPQSHHWTRRARLAARRNSAAQPRACSPVYAAGDPLEGWKSARRHPTAFLRVRTDS